MHRAHLLLYVTPSIESHSAADENAAIATPAPPAYPTERVFSSDQTWAGARLHPLPNISTSIVTEGYVAKARDHRGIGRCFGALDVHLSAVLAGLLFPSDPPRHLNRSLAS